MLALLVAHLNVFTAWAIVRQTWECRRSRLNACGGVGRARLRC